MIHSASKLSLTLLLMACGDSAAPTSKPNSDQTVDTSDPLVTETDADSDGETPVDTNNETGETGETSETSETGETGETGETATPGDTAEACADCAPSSASVSLSLSAEHLVPNAARARNNPLKGFITSYLWGDPESDFPDQMEFLYLPMNTLWNASGDTLEEGLEPYLVAAEGRGHHAVLRVYIDYPSKPSGLPEHLSGSVSCEPYSEHGGGCSPDYSDPELVDAMTGLIAAMGDRYDGDHRLGFIQLGLLGFWGEWHTWPYSDWFPSEEIQNTILHAYDSAFSITHLQIRRAAASSVGLRMGFHDDSFAYSTLGEIDWFFLPGLESAGAAERWREVPVGGELRPELQSSVFRSDYVLGEYAQDMTACIEETHASYLLNYYAFNGDDLGYTGDERVRAEDAALRLGYQFEMLGATANISEMSEGTITLGLELELSQTGVAPFYYPLSIELMSPVLSGPRMGHSSLHTLMPGDSQFVSVDVGRVPVEIMHDAISLSLKSPLLLDGQSISLATHTPWSTETGPTSLQWTITCEVEGESYPVGSVVSTTEDGCDCVCDVDAQLRSCGGDVCAPLPPE
jgi:hypothetical protein